jgi:hypothetical protein
VPGPSAQKAGMPRPSPDHAFPVKASRPVQAPRQALRRLRQQPTGESVTLAHLDNTSDTPGSQRKRWTRLCPFSAAFLAKNCRATNDEIEYDIHQMALPEGQQHGPSGKGKNTCPRTRIEPKTARARGWLIAGASTTDRSEEDFHWTRRQGVGKVRADGDLGSLRPGRGGDHRGRHARPAGSRRIPGHPARRA